jgi:hypothetical protein
MPGPPVFVMMPTFRPGGGFWVEKAIAALTMSSVSWNSSTPALRNIAEAIVA